eukprot:6197525-Pleurochrysis_carterae.AAC.1
MSLNDLVAIQIIACWPLATRGPVCEVTFCSQFFVASCFPRLCLSSLAGLWLSSFVGLCSSRFFKVRLRGGAFVSSDEGDKYVPSTARDRRSGVVDFAEKESRATLLWPREEWHLIRVPSAANKCSKGVNASFMTHIKLPPPFAMGLPMTKPRLSLPSLTEMLWIATIVRAVGGRGDIAYMLKISATAIKLAG